MSRGYDDDEAYQALRDEFDALVQFGVLTLFSVSMSIVLGWLAVGLYYNRRRNNPESPYVLVAEALCVGLTLALAVLVFFVPEPALGLIFLTCFWCSTQACSNMLHRWRIYKAT